MPECPVCRNELSGGNCPHCAASARIQQAYFELSGLRGRGINVDAALRLVGRARELLDERDYSSLDDFLEGASMQAAEAEEAQRPLRRALDEAAGKLWAHKRSGRGARRLEQALERAEKFLRDGDLEGARLLTGRLPAFLRELEEPAAAPAAGATPRYLSSCPSCNKHVMKKWRKCPHCLTPLAKGDAAQAR